jgi:hypothetical protein
MPVPQEIRTTLQSTIERASHSCTCQLYIHLLSTDRSWPLRCSPSSSWVCLLPPDVVGQILEALTSVPHRAVEARVQVEAAPLVQPPLFHWLGTLLTILPILYMPISFTTESTRQANMVDVITLFLLTLDIPLPPLQDSIPIHNISSPSVRITVSKAPVRTKYRQSLRQPHKLL